MLRVETPLFRVRSAAIGMACTIMLFLSATNLAYGAPADIGATVVAASDRSPEDRKADVHRQPAKFLDFTGVKPGMTVFDLMAGDGATVGKSLHRIEESTVIAEVEAAGFQKEAEADFLRQPTDPKDAPFFKMGDLPTDQFVLKFEKP